MTTLRDTTMTSTLGSEHGALALVNARVKGGSSWSHARSDGCAQQSHYLLCAATALATAAALASVASYTSCADEDMDNYPIRAIYGAGILHLPGPAEAIAHLNAGDIQLDTKVVQRGGIKSDVGNVLWYDLRGAGDFFTTDGPYCDQPPADLAEWWALATFGHVDLSQVLFNSKLEQITMINAAIDWIANDRARTARRDGQPSGQGSKAATSDEAISRPSKRQAIAPTAVSGQAPPPPSPHQNIASAPPPPPPPPPPPKLTLLVRSLIAFTISSDIPVHPSCCGRFLIP